MAWWKKVFRTHAPEEDLDREVAFHIEELTQTNICKGMNPVEARRQAVLEFGGREQVKQELRDLHSSAFLEGVSFNLSAAMRFIRRSPSFAAAVMLTLALGIGANSAVFSAIDAIVLRPLPFPSGDQLVVLYQHDSKNRDANHFVAPVRLEDWNRMASAFQGISGYYKDDLSETSGPFAEKVTEALVAPRFLQVMGTSPLLGRDFTAEEERFGGPDAALISYSFWQRRLQSDPEALGKKLHVGSFSYSIIGIMSASFLFPDQDVDLWTPSAPDAPYAQRRDSTWFTVIGRVKPGVTVANARADLATVQSRLGKQFPIPDGDLTVELQPLKEVIVSDVRSSLWLLYGSVSLLLLIACSNIAALLLARTSDRTHELSIRFSLGASRRAVITQLLTEVFVLALAGSLLGLLVAGAATSALHSLSKTLPRAQEISLNWRIVVYSLACAFATTLLCGLFPAVRAARRELARDLAHSSRTQVSTRNPLQWILVGVQVMLAVTLLTGAGLLLRSLQELSRVSPGFDPSHILTFQISGSWGETSDMKNLIRRIDRTLDGLRALPGVEAAATGAGLPGVPSLYQVEFTIDGREDPNRKILADNRTVSAGYFDTMRIPLLAGEGCKQASTTIDVIVNRSFQERYLNNTPPLGHVLKAAAYNDFSTQGTIRGVAGDAREQGLNTPAVPTVYGCFSAPNPFPNYLVRTGGNPLLMAATIRRSIHELEPGRAVYAMMPLQEHLDDSFFENRLRTILLTLFAVTAVLLACIGLYGTLNYLGRLRQREVGIRLAMGALRGQIAMRFLLQGMRVTLAGCIAGLLLSVAAGRMIAGMLYGISSLDRSTYVAVSLLIVTVAAIASLLPAWRAARVEPVQILREE
jgi:putative ABC transport system permease protein